MAEVLAPAAIGHLIADYLEAGHAASRTLESQVRGNAASGDAASTVVAAEPGKLAAELAVYLDLLLRWNARTNLTAIRQPEEIVRRHFGESLFTGCVLSAVLAKGATILDVGSGAGFPGLPIQLLRPDLQVTLAESQGKKASFLREACRTLGVKTEVFAARVETMPPARRFDAVTLRAVDNMALALDLAGDRLSSGGWLAVLGEVPLEASAVCRFPLPDRQNSFLDLVRGAAS